MLMRVYKAVRALLFGQFIARLSSFILVPLFLKSWSAETYGEYLTIFASTSYLATIEAGFVQAAINEMTAAYARCDVPRFRGVLHSTFTLYSGIAAVGTTALLVAAFRLPFRPWLHLRSISDATAAITVCSLGIYVLWNMPFRLVFGVFQSTGDLARTQWLTNIQQILALIASAALLLNHRGLALLSFVPAATLMAVAAASFLLIRSGLPELVPGFGGAQWGTVGELTSSSVLFFLLTLANLAVFQGSVMLSAAVGAGVAVAVFSVSRTLSILVRSCTDAFNNAFWPEIARFDAQGNQAGLRRIHRMILAGSFVFTIGLAAFLGTEGKPFVTVWTGGRIAADVVLIRLLLIMSVLQIPWLAGYSLAAACNRHKNLVRYYVIASAVGLASAMILVRWLGLRAVPIGLIIGEALGCYHFIVRDACQRLGEEYAPFAARVWITLAVISLPAYLITQSIESFAANMSLVLRMPLILLVSLTSTSLSTWLVWLTPTERGQLKQRLRLNRIFSESTDYQAGAGAECAWWTLLIEATRSRNRTRIGEAVAPGQGRLTSPSGLRGADVKVAHGASNGGNYYESPDDLSHQEQSNPDGANISHKKMVRY